MQDKQKPIQNNENDILESFKSDICYESLNLKIRLNHNERNQQIFVDVTF